MKIELNERQIKLIAVALETHSRSLCGQIGLSFNTALESALYMYPETNYGHFRAVLDNSLSEFGSLFLSSFTAGINHKLKNIWKVISVPFMLNHIIKRGEIAFVKSEPTTKHFMFVNCANVEIVLDVPSY